jgi:hypothetical protein
MVSFIIDGNLHSGKLQVGNWRKRGELADAELPAGGRAEVQGARQGCPVRRACQALN